MIWNGIRLMSVLFFFFFHILITLFPQPLLFFQQRRCDLSVSSGGKPGTNAVLSSGGRTDRLVPVSPDLGAGHALYQQAGSKGAAADFFLDQASCFEAGLEGGLLDLEKI